ncbi:MAG: hypothetical protein GTO63_34685, partial [Anaerolineae bacterium]|nr:hypothetical protein [Anaerolineae bacterium]NIN99846.1 hypothetical protein [Anaerolineae bacterium]NIQ82621.1 hypothetical protein [Anaerolineae bacterium]
RKAKAVLEKITEGLSKREYLQNCSPEHLRQNLILATILWLEAVKREWVDEATFYTSTHRLWSILFFMREGEASGWIEHRDRNTAPSGAFVARMANPLLSACLLAWTLWLPPRDTAEYNRLILASSLAMARMPALWNGGGDDREQVREGLEKLLADIGLEELASRERAKRVRLEWDRLIQRAQALRAIEFVLGNKQSIAPARQVTQGELLYHPTLGFCVAVEAFPSKHSRNLKVLMLQDKADKPKMFHPGNYILSLQAVLRCKEFEPGGRLEKERKAVESLLCEMSGLASQA